MSSTNEQRINAAITYFDHAVREIDDIIANCGDMFKKTVHLLQREYFETALEVMRGMVEAEVRKK